MDERGRRGVGRAKGDESATREDLRSFWRRFWNHIVTALGSLVVPALAAERTGEEGGKSVRTNRVLGLVIRAARATDGKRGGRAARAWRAGSQ